MRMFEVDDGATHWVNAADVDDAIAVYAAEDRGGDAEDPVTAADVTEISEERAATLSFNDGYERVSSMLEECRRDPSRRYVACSEW